ncbi:chemotaxis protein CheA [Alsobacter metallidurans]|uniref:Chemotaxis protein CheA n=1 Tax=Alsobacter metallidurans TaxID=340221 RepID=A0A917MI19_9HYPH|nr:chemotaxis protein CheA [Alsobacter metallidurans]GGH23880.1 chemotaxis protein CheA [Alsobacter metallidurans]
MHELDPVATFRQEAADLLEELEQTLLDLNANPAARDLIDAAFRAMHTIKGSGAMFGFTDVATFTHDFETAFDLLRKSGAQPSPRLIEVALAGTDHIRALIEDSAGTDPVFGDAILSDLRELLGQAAPDLHDAASATREPVSARPAVRYGLTLRFAPDVTVNGTNPLLLLDELRGLGDCVVEPLLDRLPPLGELDVAECHVGWRVDLTTDKPRSAIEDVFMFVLDDMELDIAEQSDASPLAPNIAPAPARAATPAERADAAEPVVAAVPEVASRADDRGSTVRVQAERLDRLMDRVGELVIAQARLSQLAHNRREPALQAVAEEIERLSAGLRDTAMGLRMMPIGTLFARFRRLVHDLSGELGKPLEFVTSGEETELDKTMIERLADPLVHVIRNAVDHGLETPDVRLAAGKGETGLIRLSARHIGAEVHVSVRDDGRGLDLARIRAKAEEQGLLTPGAPASESELVQLLFAPGFSTAREVSALSGRGVGMDVVKQTIEAMRGHIDVTSAPGQGSTFTMRLPLTLAIIEGLLVRVANGRYVIPLSAVEECIELDRRDDQRSAGRSFLNVRGALVPFLRLREAFGETDAPGEHQKVVVVAAGQSRVGLVVDQILGHHQTVIKSLSRLHADVGAFSGATIMGDGLPALILDVGQLVGGRARPVHGDREAA